MRVVVDTNVLVSAALRDRDPEVVLLHIVRTPGIEWIATARILNEYRAVLRRPKFALPADVLAEWDRLIDAAVLVLDPPPPVRFEPDPDDAEFVACALTHRADVLLTGDHRLLGTGRLGGTVVVTVEQFKRALDRAEA